MFDSVPSHHNKCAGVAQLVEHLTCNQGVEHLTFNQRVEGSSPSWLTSFYSSKSEGAPS